MANGIIIDKVDYNHNDQSYRVKEMETRCLITRNSKHIKATPITAEKYPWEKLSKNTMMVTVEDILKLCTTNIV